MGERLVIQRKAVKAGRAALSRERVLEAALELADRDGIDSLSMRRLAQRLDVEAMSLYYWFKGKAELLSAMVGAVYAEYRRPTGDADWREDLRRSAISAHETLLLHPWAATLMGSAGPSRAQFEWMDDLLGRLRSAGFSAEMTHHAYHALESHIVGYTLWVLPILAVEPGAVAAFAEDIARSQLPHLIEHVEYHMRPDRTGERPEFEFGLDLILDGLEARRSADAGSPAG
jgi:AcrR family transcriptional regulator